MPFDGIEQRAEVEVISRAIEILGPNGENWTQFEFSSEGRHCIIGALNQARRELNITGDKSAKHIRHALSVIYPASAIWSQPLTIVDFNDVEWRRFSEVARVLAYARSEAAGEEPSIMRFGGNAMYLCRV